MVSGCERCTDRGIACVPSRRLARCKACRRNRVECIYPPPPPAGPPPPKGGEDEDPTTIGDWLSECHDIYCLGVLAQGVKQNLADREFVQNEFDRFLQSYKPDWEDYLKAKAEAAETAMAETE